MVDFQWWWLITCAFAVMAAMGGYVIVHTVVHKLTIPLSYRLTESGLSAVRIILFYASYFVMITFLLSLLGFNMTALLGAAGICGVALGFAAQATIANIISGLFLLIEQSVRVTDVIAVGAIKGRITHIGLLSVTLKTMHNTLIRVPNEQLLKANVVNYSAFPDRALEFVISCSAHVDTEVCERALKRAWGLLDDQYKQKELSLLYMAGSSTAFGITALIWVPKTTALFAKSAYIKAVYEVARQESLELYIAPK